MKLPKGLKLPHPNLVCKLKKSLYGLKQASRQWHQKLTTSLISNAFQQSSADHSLMTKKTKNGDLIALLIYVDDVLLTSNNMELIQSIKNYLNEEFRIKDYAKYFFGS